MQTGNGPKVSFEVEKKFGGLENIPNQSLVPRRPQAFEENRKLKNKQPEDPLKQLLIKQREEGRTGHPIIKRILFDTNSYTITLMTDLAVQNIANFCCTEHTKYKTMLNFDFTIELLKKTHSMLLLLRIKILHSMLKIPGVVRPYWTLFFCAIKEARI